MNYLKIDGMDVSVFAVAQAYSQLEADYNMGGWLRERPSNQRRMESIGVQLSRMQYSNAYDFTNINAEPQDGDDSDDEDVRYLYCANVLKWDLPIDADLAKTIERIFVPEVLAPYKERLEQATLSGQWSPGQNRMAQAPRG